MSSAVKIKRPVHPHHGVAVRHRVASTWIRTPLAADGYLEPAEWADAGKFAIDGGFVMVKNDGTSLWLAIDVVRDTGDDVDLADYFWLEFDIDRNRKLTPYRDIQISPMRGRPDRLGASKIRSATSWGRIYPLPTSLLRKGFGPTLNSQTPHRFWEMRINFTDLKVALLTLVLGTPAIVRFGVRVASETPEFRGDTPKRLMNFADFTEVVLAPPFVDYGVHAGLVIGGIGSIPAGVIDKSTGLATWKPAGATAVAFAQTLQFLGNTATLQAMKAAGVTTFSIEHKLGDTSSGVSLGHLRTTWTNYRAIGGGTYEAEAFGPDAADRYKVPDLGTDYLVKALLFQWATAGEPNGLHTLTLNAYDAAGTVRYTDTLTIYIDNHVPDAEVLDVTYGGKSIGQCDIVNVSRGDSVQVKIRAYDGEGLLSGYSVDGRYGSGQPVNAANVAYDPSTMGTYWNGVDGEIVPLTPPTSCAYEIRVVAYGRVTNGYRSDLQYDVSSRFVTLQVV